MKPIAFTLLVLAAGCAATRAGSSGQSTGYRGIEEVRILVKGME